MNCLETLQISPGATLAIGSGGKTTLLRALAGEARAAGRTVVLATTTHVLPFPEVPTVASADQDDVRTALAEAGIACAAAPASEAGKLGPSPIPLARLADLADYLLVEADGSRHRPLKAHGPGEPATSRIQGTASRTVLVVGAHGFGKPVGEAAHRPELFCRRAGLDEVAGLDTTATPELAARVVAAEIDGGIMRPDVIVLNAAREDAGAAAGCRAFAKSLAARGVRVPVRVINLGTGTPLPPA